MCAPTFYRTISIFVLSLIIGVVSMTVRAQNNPKKLAEATKQSQEAADVFTEIMNVPDKSIPRGLLDKAEAIAVFEVVKAGFIVGGRGGHGVISRRVRGGWSAPAFFNLGGGSIGLQIGASKTDVILLFMNTGALEGLLQDKFEIGGRDNRCPAEGANPFVFKEQRPVRWARNQRFGNLAG